MMKTFDEALLEVRNDIAAGNISVRMASPDRCVGGVMRERYPHLFPAKEGMTAGLLSDSEGDPLFFFKGASDDSDVNDVNNIVKACDNFLAGNRTSPWAGV